MSLHLPRHHPCAAFKATEGTIGNCRGMFDITGFELGQELVTRAMDRMKVLGMGRFCF